MSLSEHARFFSGCCPAFWPHWPVPSTLLSHEGSWAQLVAMGEVASLVRLEVFVWSLVCVQLVSVCFLEWGPR